MYHDDEDFNKKREVEANSYYRKMVQVLSSLGYDKIADAIVEISNRLKNDAKGNLKSNKEVADYLKDAILHLDLASNDIVLASKKLKK